MSTKSNSEQNISSTGSSPGTKSTIRAGDDRLSHISSSNGEKNSVIEDKGNGISDPLGLLQSEHLAAAAAAADATVVSQSRKRKYKTAAEKLEANRKSAAESRLRKKVTLMKLQERVNLLRQENSLLHLENKQLKTTYKMSKVTRAPSYEYGMTNSSLLNSLESSFSKPILLGGCGSPRMQIQQSGATFPLNREKIPSLNQPISRLGFFRNDLETQLQLDVNQAAFDFNRPRVSQLYYSL